MLAGRCQLLLGLAVTFAAAAPPSARAQIVLFETETLDFDRPESWGMKYYSSLAILTSMGAPRLRDAGAIEIGFEGGGVPQLSDAERRLGFNGTRLEAVNRTRVFGRVRASVGLGQGLALEAAYTPPIELGGARPNILALGLARPIDLAPAWRLGVRGYGHVGRIEGDITCSAAEVAAGDDAEANPFRCVRPSQDESVQRVFGLELVAGYDGFARFKPYAGGGIGHMDLEFRADAVYSGGRVEDHTLQLTSGTTAFAIAGVSFAAGPRLQVSAELFYSWLSIVRPPSATPANEGFLNARAFVSYRVR